MSKSNINGKQQTTLSEHIARNGLTAGGVIKLGIDICDALILCRNNNTAYNGITEADIFTGESGNYMLRDFFVESTSETEREENLDVYSIGVILYKLLNNQKPPETPPHPLPLYAKNKLGEIVVKACSDIPLRYDSLDELKTDLNEYLDAIPNEERNIVVIADAATAKAVSVLEQETSTPKAVCVNCGAVLPEKGIFCANCGHRREQTQTAQEYPTLAATEPTLAQAEPTLAQAEPTLAQIENVTSQTEPSAEEPAKTPPKIHRSLGMALGSFIISTILGLFLLASTAGLLAFIIVRPANLSKTVEQTDIAVILEEQGLIDDITVEIQSLVNSEYTRSSEFAAAFGQINADEVLDLLNDENIKTEIGSILINYAEAVASGNFDYHLNSGDAIDLLKTLAPEIQREFDYVLTNDDYDTIAEYIDTKVNLERLSVSNLLSETDVDSNITRIVFSVYPLIIFSILTALFMLDIILLHRRKIRMAFLNLSIPLTLTGLSYVFAGLMLGSFSGAIDDDIWNKITRLTSGIASISLYLGLICLGIGLAAFIIFSIIRLVRKKHIPRQTTQKRGGAKFAFMFALINIIVILSCGTAVLFLTQFIENL